METQREEDTEIHRNRHTKTKRHKTNTDTHTGHIHKLASGNLGDDPAVHKLITKTRLTVYKQTTLLANRIV